MVNPRFRENIEIKLSPSSEGVVGATAALVHQKCVFNRVYSGFRIFKVILESIFTKNHQIFRLGVQCEGVSSWPPESYAPIFLTMKTFFAELISKMKNSIELNISAKQSYIHVLWHHHFLARSEVSKYFSRGRSISGDKFYWKSPTTCLEQVR